MRRKKEFLIIVLFLVLIFLTQNVEAQTWQATKRLTWNSGDSWYPAIATDSSGNIHVVWHDYTPGNREIYYKKILILCPGDYLPAGIMRGVSLELTLTSKPGMSGPKLPLFMA